MKETRHIMQDVESAESIFKKRTRELETLAVKLKDTDSDSIKRLNTLKRDTSQITQLRIQSQALSQVNQIKDLKGQLSTLEGMRKTDSESL